MSVKKSHAMLMVLMEELLEVFFLILTENAT